MRGDHGYLVLHLSYRDNGDFFIGYAATSPTQGGMADSPRTVGDGSVKLDVHTDGSLLGVEILDGNLPISKLAAYVRDAIVGEETQKDLIERVRRLPQMGV